MNVILIGRFSSSQYTIVYRKYRGPKKQSIDFRRNTRFLVLRTQTSGFTKRLSISLYAALERILPDRFPPNSLQTYQLDQDKIMHEI